jgi:hypothetical protein
VTFGQPADRGVAGHLTYSISVDGQQKGLATHAGGRQGRFDASVAGTDYDNVVLFWVGKHV